MTGGPLRDWLPDWIPGGGSEPDATRVLTVGRTPEEVRASLADRTVLTQVLAEPYTGDPSTWTVEVLEEVEERVRFTARSGQDDPLQVTGSFAFATAPQDLGTEVTLALQLSGPDLAAGATAHKVLRRTKALLETGEVPTTAHNPSARHAPDQQPDQTEES